MTVDFSLAAMVLGFGLMGLPVFIGGTIGILFSKLASWKVRRFWALRSLYVPAATVHIVVIVRNLADPSAGIWIVVGAIVIAPIANWLTFNRYKARNAVATEPGPSAARPPSTSLTLALIVFVVGLGLSVKSVFFAVEMFYGGPWQDPYFAHYMGVATVMLAASVLWAGVHLLRKSFALRAQGRRARLAV
jgi:hypothetical protein